MIVKRGYHRMQTAEGQIIEGPLVVELKEDGTFLSYHLLQQEEPATEWVGGTYVNSKLTMAQCAFNSNSNSYSK